MSLSRWSTRVRSVLGFATGALRRRAKDHELDEEIRFHIDRAAERNLRAGMSAAEARRAALVAFGGASQWTEAARDEQRSQLLNDTVRDLAYGVAALRRNPAFAISAIVTIGLGLAATVTAFSFVNSIYLRPLAVPEGSRLVRIMADRPDLDVQLGWPAFRQLQGARAYDRIAAHYSTAPLYLTARGASAEEMGAVVSANYFPMLGIRPALGRFFLPAEDSVPDRDAVAVLGYALWQRRFGGDTGVIGETIAINGRAFTIIGVGPQGFDGVTAGEVNELWIPSMMLHTGYRWCDGFQASCAITDIIARLAPEATLSQARAEMTALTPRIIAATDPADSITHVQVTSATGVPGRQQRSFAHLSELLGGIAVILLLIACANMSGLLLARGLARERELALRAALGAGRWRIARQLLTESLIIGTAGGVLGAVLSIWSSRTLIGFFGSDDEGYLHRYDVSFDWRIFAFALLATAVAALLFGLLPALRASRVNLADSLKRGGTPAGARMRMALVGGQVVLALVLLIGAGLLTRSFDRIMLGGDFDPSHIAQVRLRPRLVSYAPERAQAYLHKAMAAITALPGVIAAVPVRGSISIQATGRTTVGPPASERIPSELAARLEYYDVGPGYFAAIHAPVVAGREFNDHDDSHAPLVAMVNQSLAARLWPNGDAVGQVLRLRDRVFTVVGVVKDYRLHHAGEPATPMAYTAFWQSSFEPQTDARVVIRVQGDPVRALDPIRRALARVDPDVPVTETLSMERQMAAQFTEVRLGGAVLVAGAALALLLTAIGLYGVVAFLAAQRTREVGVRLAVGARPRDVVALFLRQGMRTIWIGSAIGVIISLAAAPLLSQWLFGVSPFDAVSVVVAVSAVSAAAGLASYIPARKAARVDPARVLRGD